MAGHICPLLQSECNKECKWYIDDADECAVVALAWNLHNVTFNQIGGASLKVIED